MLEALRLTGFLLMLLDMLAVLGLLGSVGYFPFVPPLKKILCWPGVLSSLHIVRLDFTCLRVSEMIFRNPETSKFRPDFLPAANFGK